ncbi:MAG TPA: hypothetical protein VD905_07215, partial [Flavobacteriales bacterium]|nr:hypothetical protein [Flavobacteriales bacterium]
RALPVSAGEHIIEFSFKPKAYYTGNKITMASSWLALLVFLACMAWSFKEQKSKPVVQEGKKETNTGKDSQLLDQNLKK